MPDIFGDEYWLSFEQQKSHNKRVTDLISTAVWPGMAVAANNAEDQEDEES